MRGVEAVSPSERRVLRWFLAALLVAAVLVIALTWWRKSAQCAASCAAAGHASSQLEFTGGGRLAMGVTCRCAPAAANR